MPGSPPPLHSGMRHNTTQYKLCHLQAGDDNTDHESDDLVRGSSDDWHSIHLQQLISFTKNLWNKEQQEGKGEEMGREKIKCLSFSLTHNMKIDLPLSSASQPFKSFPTNTESPCL